MFDNTISFSTCDQTENEFEVTPIVLTNMQDEVNIGVSFLRRLKLNIEFDRGADIISSPFLGKLREKNQSPCVQLANVVAPELIVEKLGPPKARFSRPKQLV